MNSCQHCDKNGSWVCLCSNVYLCHNHKDSHLDSIGEHDIHLVRIPLEGVFKDRACDELSKRLEMNSKYKLDLEKYTEKLVNELTTLNTNCLIRISKQRKEYVELLKLTRKTDVTAYELEKIQDLISSTCQYDVQPHGDFSESIKNFYEQVAMKTMILEKPGPDQGIQRIAK